ncbi:hypothetical protein EDB19DRAFT_1773600 [Suillus lakei]|nr:hypothetical protein EDB19DRAFT_1773600 [Suillus lakei]
MVLCITIISIYWFCCNVYSLSPLIRAISILIPLCITAAVPLVYHLLHHIHVRSSVPFLTFPPDTMKQPNASDAQRELPPLSSQSSRFQI